jgi:hypothetical protein
MLLRDFLGFWGMNEIEGLGNLCPLAAVIAQWAAQIAQRDFAGQFEHLDAVHGAYARFDVIPIANKIKGPDVSVQAP